jgi:hypothetical protein
MSYQEIEHLCDVLDNDHIKHKVLAGLTRLLEKLEEQVAVTTDHLNFEDDVDRSAEPMIDGLPESLVNAYNEAKHQLYQVRTILFALALPANHIGNLSYHLWNAFFTIGLLLRDYSIRQDSECAPYKERAGTSAPQADVGSLSPTLSETNSSGVKEKLNTAPQSDHSPISESPVSPYVEFMVNLALELGVTTFKMKKEEVRDRIKQRWDADTLGDPSAHLVDVMATLMRPPEAQKGGAKPQALNP